MILVDERVGSREFLPDLRRLGVQSDLAGKLDADFQWEGNGSTGSVLCGVERKSIQDLLNSMRGGRLAGHQIGHMLESLDVCYLLVEGLWRRGRETGLVETKNGEWKPARGQVRYSELTRFLASLEELGGIRLWRTTDTEESAAWLVETYSWWQKPYTEHRTNRTIYCPEPPPKNKRGRRPSLFKTDPTLLERWLSCLPRIDGRTEELAKYFSSAYDLATSDVDRWLTIEGMKIGKKTAEDIVAKIRGSE